MYRANLSCKHAVVKVHSESTCSVNHPRLAACCVPACFASPHIPCRPQRLMGQRCSPRTIQTPLVQGSGTKNRLVRFAGPVPGTACLAGQESAVFQPNRREEQFCQLLGSETCRLAESHRLYIYTTTTNIY